MKYVFLINLILLSACGPIEVDHDVSGTVTTTGTVTVQVDTSSFLPFFTSDCASRQAGQECYNQDSTVCAACMAQALYNSLGLASPSPSPSPTGS